MEKTQGLRKKSQGRCGAGGHSHMPVVARACTCAREGEGGRRREGKKGRRRRRRLRTPTPALTSLAASFFGRAAAASEAWAWARGRSSSVRAVIVVLVAAAAAGFGDEKRFCFRWREISVAAKARRKKFARGASFDPTRTSPPFFARILVPFCSARSASVSLSISSRPANEKNKRQQGAIEPLAPGKRCDVAKVCETDAGRVRRSPSHQGARRVPLPPSQLSQTTPCARPTPKM